MIGEPIGTCSIGRNWRDVETPACMRVSPLECQPDE